MLRCNFQPWMTTILTLAITTVVTLTFLLYLTFAATKPKVSGKRILSPRDTLLPFLSGTKALTLSYPPNILPGARDIKTPYGMMRCYEWGPEGGRKVVMVHGDTTPGPVFGPIAVSLVKRGCRVLILDLWGRGYSDTPLGLPHDARLFATQIVFAVASSSLSWMGASSGGFSIIGFSLGGGITMSFAAQFPYLIDSIILLAPAGILRSIPSDYETIFFRYPSLVPSRYLRRLVGRILGVDMTNRVHSQTGAEVRLPNHAGLQVPTESEYVANQTPDVPAIVQWQFDNHQGFVYSFINTIQHGPLMDQQASWKEVCDIIRGRSSGDPASNRFSNLHNSKILAIFGDSDGIVVAKEVREDLEQLLGGTEHLEVKMVPGNHGFPVPSSDQVVKHISDFWNLEIVK